MAHYIPSGSSVGSVIERLSDYLKVDLAVPGNWSPRLFFDDLKNNPVRDKRILAQTIHNALEIPITYLKFFEITRGYPRPVNDYQKELLQIFNDGSVMLYFEDLFLELFLNPSKDEKELLKYLKALSQLSISKWNQVVEGIGASSYQFFAKDPHAYAKLLHRVKDTEASELMDREILECLPEIETIVESRADLVSKFKETQI